MTFNAHLALLHYYRRWDILIYAAQFPPYTRSVYNSTSTRTETAADSLGHS